MMQRFFKSAVALSCAATLAACGSKEPSLGPTIQLTEAQTEDLIDALDALSYESDIGFSQVRASVRALARNPGVALATQSINESEACPIDGTTGYTGGITIAEDFTGGNINITQTFSDCKAESSTGTLWTINGAPNVKTNMSFTMNLSTSSATVTGTQTGAINASSSMGEGSCSISLTLNMTSNETSDSGTITGTVCGKPYSESFSETF